MPDFGEIAHNLLTLEINTVLKDGMSAQRMPSPADALIDTAQEYHIFLCQLAREFAGLGSELPPWARKLSDSFEWGLEPFAQPAAAAPATAGDKRRQQFDPHYLERYPSEVGKEDLDKLREIAAWLREMRDRVRAVKAGRDYGKGARLDDAERAQASACKLNDEHDPILFRIQRNCDQLKGLPDLLGGKARRSSHDGSSAGTKVALPPEDLLILRKAWDISTEIVVMQTVVQIDGDVVSRILPGRESVAFAQLHALHSDAVSISFRHWRFLVATLGRMAGKAIDTLFRR